MGLVLRGPRASPALPPDGQMTAIRSGSFRVRRRELPLTCAFSCEAEEIRTRGLEDAVRFVLLRTEAQGEQHSLGSGREYRHRWLVSGHFRNQWYRSEQTHKVIWIAPYVKGPDDAPLKPTVYKVSR